MTRINAELLTTCIAARKRIRQILPLPALRCVDNFQIVDRAQVFFLCADSVWMATHPAQVSLFNQGLITLDASMRSFLTAYEEASQEGLPVHRWTPGYDTDRDPIVTLLYPESSKVRTISSPELSILRTAVTSVHGETSPPLDVYKALQVAMDAFNQAQALSATTVLYEPFFNLFDRLVKSTIQLCVTRNRFHCSHTVIATDALVKIIRGIASARQCGEE